MKNYSNKPLSIVEQLIRLQERVDTLENTDFTVFFVDGYNDDNISEHICAIWTVKNGTQIKLFDNIPEYRNTFNGEYTFDGWLLNNTGEPLTGQYTVTNNVMFYAKWTESPKYTVTYYDNGITSSQTVYAGPIYLPSSQRAGFSLEWLLNNAGDPLTGRYTVTDDVEFHAKWTQLPRYTVTFDNDGDISYRMAYAGEQINLPSASKTGFTLGWFLNDTGETFVGQEQSTVTNDVEFHAKWIESPKYTVTFYDDKLIPELSQTVSAGAQIVLPNRSKTDFVLNGWVSNVAGNVMKGQYYVNDNVEFHAVWSVPTPISTEAELKAINNNSGGFILMNDITLTDEWMPINFNGTLDGNGFVISGLYGSGLFDRLENAVIYNLGVETTGTGIKCGNCGGIANNAYSSLIESSYFSGIVVSNYRGGGIVGESVSSTISNCYSAGIIMGTSYGVGYGGIAGRADYGVVTTSYSTATVLVEDSGWAGGIIGIADGSTVINNNAAMNDAINGDTNPNRVVSEIQSGSVFGNIAKEDIIAGNSPFDTTSAGYGTNKTDAELKTQSTYEDIGWDFDTVWKMPADGGYPIFQWQ